MQTLDDIMSAVNGIAGPPGLWNIATNAQGRVYYYNTETKATQWTKPPELMTPAEVRLPVFEYEFIDIDCQ